MTHEIEIDDIHVKLEHAPWCARINRRQSTESVQSRPCDCGVDKAMQTIKKLRKQRDRARTEVVRLKVWIARHPTKDPKE